MHLHICAHRVQQIIKVGTQNFYDFEGRLDLIVLDNGNVGRDKNMDTSTGVQVFCSGLSTFVVALIGFQHFMHIPNALTLSKM